MNTVVHAICGYWFLLLTVRMLGRRPGAQMTPFEFVIIFIVGGAIIRSTVGNDHSITNCICAIITIGVMHNVASWLKLRWPRVGALIDGTPLILVNDGEWQDEVMRGMQIDANDVMASARTKNVRTLEDIKYAILERNGAISIIKHDAE